MKIKILLISMMLGTAVIAQVPTDGLVSHYSFSSNAKDNSGNSHNGTVHGATLTNDRFGNKNSAYSFDGIDDYIDCGNSTEFNLNQFSLSLWFQETVNPSTSAGLISKSTDVNGEVGYRIEASGDNHTYLVWSQMGIIQSGTGNVMSSETFDSNWNHIVGIKSNDSLLIYQNGKLTGISTGMNKVFNNPSPLLIGAVFQGAPTSFFGGSIDDIRVYDRALDSAEIQTLYHEGTCFVTVTDTAHVTVYDTAYTTVYDTTHVTEYDTTHVTVYDTSYITITDTNYVTVHDTNYVTVNDTNYVTVYDTVYISVTDTLIIDVTITGIAKPNNTNILRVYPNPAKDKIYIDNGDYSLMTGYSVKIVNHIGQEVFTSTINQQKLSIDVNQFGATGIYFIQIIDPNNAVIETRKILLE